MATYDVTSPEGANFASGETKQPVEVGAQVDLDLDKDKERALVAAGWLAHGKKKEAKS